MRVASMLWGGGGENGWGGGGSIQGVNMRGAYMLQWGGEYGMVHPCCSRGRGEYGGGCIQGGECGGTPSRGCIHAAAAVNMGGGCIQGACIHAAAGSASWMHPAPPPVNRITHACENITFAALLRNAVGNNL